MIQNTRTALKIARQDDEKSDLLIYLIQKFYEFSKCRLRFEQIRY